MKKIFWNLKWKIWAWRHRKKASDILSHIVLENINGVPVYQFKMSQYDPTDIKGLPIFDDKEFLARHEMLHSKEAERFFFGEDVFDEGEGDNNED